MISRSNIVTWGTVQKRKKGTVQFVKTKHLNEAFNVQYLMRCKPTCKSLHPSLCSTYGSCHQIFQGFERYLRWHLSGYRSCHRIHASHPSNGIPKPSGVAPGYERRAPSCSCELDWEFSFCDLSNTDGF